MPNYDWSFDDPTLGTLFQPGKPICYHCGTSAAEGVPAPRARCAQCHYILHTCPNCQFYNGVGCMILDPGFYADGAVIGQFCQSFTWRQVEATPRIAAKSE